MSGEQSSMPPLVCVRSFLTRFEAEYAKSLLEAHEIPAIVMADDGGGLAPAMPILARGGARVLVRQQDVDRADKILRHGDD